MRLAGQGERGYAMAALLVGLSVMSVLMGALLPVWSQMVTREKEQELIFRGEQYARAIGLFQRKYANTPPPTIDVLVEQRFLRKKFKDPITNDDFQPIYANQAAMGIGAPTGAQRPGQQATVTLATPAPTSVAGGTAPTGAAGGIIGVTSKSKESSIKLYNGRDRYNEWAFVYIQTAQRPGGPGGGGMAPSIGGPGGPGQRPGQGGQPGQQRPGQTGQPGQTVRPPVVMPGGSGFQPFGSSQPGTTRPPG